MSENSAELVIETFPVGPLACNCTIIGDPQTGKGLIIDPGWDAELIQDKVTGLGFEIQAAIHTHAHIDHINGTRGVHEALGAPALLHEGDLELYRGIDEQALMLQAWGLPVEVHRPPEPDGMLLHEQLVGQGRYEMEVLHTPGHTAGSLCFYLAGGTPLLFSGDTLFQMGVGRTDLPGGDSAALLRSIRQTLWELPGETVVIPGHGDTTTIGEEKVGNPFVR